MHQAQARYNSCIAASLKEFVFMVAPDSNAFSIAIHWNVLLDISNICFRTDFELILVQWFISFQLKMC